MVADCTEDCKSMVAVEMVCQLALAVCVWDLLDVLEVHKLDLLVVRVACKLELPEPL